MNRHIIPIIVGCLLPLFLQAQDNVQAVWSEVERNNLTLQALHGQLEAEKIGNTVGLAPENPEVEFAYLWGSPSVIGQRIDLSVTQSFDFPTVYVHKSKMANLKNEQTELEYKKQRIDMMKEVGKLYYNIVYQNVRINDMQTCLSHLTEIADSYAQKLEMGEINIFDYNKMKLTALNMEQELKHAQIERQNLLSELAQINGGKEIAVNCSWFPAIALEADFEQWYKGIEANNPMLAWLRKELEINERQISLSRSSWAPQFFAGYMREQVPGENFQGIKVGISLPLWNNLNSVKQAKLQNSAINLVLFDQKNQFYNRLKAQHAMVVSLLQQIDNYEEVLSETSQFDLLHNALEKGEIDIVNYLLEYAMYHESHERLFELWRDAAQNNVELELYQ